MVVVCICIFHLREGTSWISRYMYGLFWCSTGMVWFLYVTLAVCNSHLNDIWFILDLLRHLVTAHFDIPRSIPTHSQYLSFFLVMIILM